MKKLMTMIAAVAMSFGLFAAGAFVSGTGFDDLSAGTTLDTTGEYWTEWTPGDGNFATVTGWEAAGETYTREIGRPVIEGQTAGQGTNFLNLKTTFGNPLYRNVTDDGDAYTLSGNLYFDSLVKFTACDEDPTATYTDPAKIIVYTKEMTDNDGETVTGTNLFVKAGQITDGSAIYDCGDFSVYGDSDGWNRLTIKVIDKVYGTDPGFELFINGLAVTYVSGTTGYNTALLSSNGKILNTAKKLFPTMVAGDASIKGVGFDGQGKVDDVAFTTLAPDFADDKYFTLQWDEHVASLKYTVNGGAEVTAAVTPGQEGSVGLLWEADMEVAVTATYGSTVQGETWAAGTWTKKSTEVSLDDTTFTVRAPDQWGKVVSKETTPRIQIGDNTYPNFAEAIADIPNSGSTTLVLNRDMTVDVDDQGATQAAFAFDAADVTLDLAGHTLTGADGAAVIECACQNFTITDSDPDKKGTIVAGDEGQAVYVTDGKLTVTGGTFEGAVELDETAAPDADIVAGNFAKASNGEDAFTLEESINEASKLGASTGDYWEVVAKDKYVISVTGAENATVTINDQEVKSLELTEDEDYTIVVTPNEHYEYVEGGEYGDFIWTDGEPATLVLEGTVAAPDSFEAADATAIEWTITYYDDSDPAEVFDTDTYTIENHETKQLNAGTRTGYNFVCWADGDGKAVTTLADKTGELELYGEWEAATYNITYNGLEDGDTNPNAATYTYGEGLTLQDATTTRAVKFLGWFDAATEGNKVTEISETQTGDVTLFAQWESAGPVDPVDGKLDPGGESNLQALKDALPQGTDINAWATEVYGTDGKIPAEKLNASSEELVKAAAEYNLKVMASPVTVAVETAEDGGFTFTLTDADDANPVVLKTKAQELIKYSASLEDGGDFAPSTDETVTAEVSNDFKVSAKFTGKDADGEAANAGFMKVDLSVAE